MVVSIRDFGAFVNIGCQTDGLLHISQVRGGDAVELAVLLAATKAARHDAQAFSWQPAARSASTPATRSVSSLTHTQTDALHHQRSPTSSPTTPPPNNPLSQISTGFVRDVNDAVSNGQAVRVRVINVDSQRGKFAVTMIPEGARPDRGASAGDEDATGERPQLKQQARAPKQARARRAAPPVKAGDAIKGKVANTAPFGVFVEVSNLIVGLQHTLGRDVGARLGQGQDCGHCGCWVLLGCVHSGVVCDAGPRRPACTAATSSMCCWPC